MSIHRYRGQLLDGAELPSLVGATTSIARRGPVLDVDINLSNDSFKDDLDEIMGTFGFTFVETSPTTPCIAIAEGWQSSVIDKDLTTPPAASDGDRYIVGASAVGAWSGHDYEIAQWDNTNTVWLYTVPVDGFVAWVDDEDVHYLYKTATNWKIYSPGAQLSESITTENITTDVAMADTLDNDPVVASVMVILNGVVQHPGAGNDYTLGGSGNRTITWLAGSGTAVDMTTTDKMLVYYTRL